MDKHTNEDVFSTRCDGLASGLAKRKIDNKLVSAEHVTKAYGPFYCPSCLSNVIVRKCTEKADHFAHHAAQSSVAKKNSALHEKCKKEIFEYLNDKFPDGRWASERSIKENREKGYKAMRPDISGVIDEKLIVIEVQASSYTLDRIIERTLEYTKMNVAILWVVPLTKKLEEFIRPRLYEKFLHSMYYGRIYYWMPENNETLTPVHFSPTKRHIHFSSWYDIDTGEQVEVGGYDLTYKTVKKPNYGEPLDIAKDFTSTQRNAFTPKNVKKSIPECIIYKDNLANWWEINEFKDVKNQTRIIKDRDGSGFLKDYDNWDDYDDYY